ncbi:hypothetical protein Ahy_A01g003847 [Arachis hypogaea]|uniref:Aminotransferase-like plant mobile domain-containing protein n=1 Tax=Arachis hypogaea TaxID=3818 RepID=A0A445EU38_ARAHY|nr:hypothetical protein Ahy_A01g003847 [Arachis hypogaea]
MHTFHMPFGEYTITLQDVAYQLRLPVNGLPVSKCLIDFEKLMEEGKPAWEWFQELIQSTSPGFMRGSRCCQMMLRRRPYSGNWVHIWWLPFVARLDDMGSYSWGSAALAWLYRCMCRVPNRNVTNLAGPLQLLQSWIFWRFLSLRPRRFDTHSFPLAFKWATYLPTFDFKEERVVQCRLALSLRVSNGIARICCAIALLNGLLKHDDDAF